MRRGGAKEFPPCHRRGAAADFRLDRSLTVRPVYHRSLRPFFCRQAKGPPAEIEVDTFLRLLSKAGAVDKQRTEAAVEFFDQV